ncbi:HAD family hydrolase [Streptomyces sp. NPDC058583]|uniref:HAD family hydrolase n=1 Tax=unclassified Streptomyces TaxID=2593676 RepID=UPI00364BAC99
MSRATVLFDLDGVLLDSRGTTLAALAGIATAALGRRVTVDTLPAGAITAPREEVLAALGVPRPGELLGSCWDIAVATAPGACVFPGVLEGLAALKDAGAATGLVTLQSRTRLPWLLQPAVLDLLDVTVCWEDAEPKPAPDGILLALDRLGRTAQHALFVGDTLTDQAAASSAGIAFAGAGWGFAGPHALAAAGAAAVLSSPAELGTGLLDLIDAAAVAEQSVPADSL